MQEKRGLFIVFDGIDGSGKSTALWNFANHLAKKDKYLHLLMTREPYQKREIRELLRQETDPYTQKEKLAELFIEDRKEHILDIIWPALISGVNVLCDRYKYATLAYQSSQGIPIEKLINAHVNLLTPDMVFIIDIPVEIAVERMSKEKRNEQKFESSGEFLEKVRQAYLMLPKLLPQDNIKIIDGTKSIEEVNEQVIKEFEKFIQEVHPD